MKKEVKDFITITSIVIVIFYCATAFIKAEPNPFRWEEETRSILAMSCILFAPFIGSIVSAITNSKGEL